jgi:hypothetical protein
MSWTKILDGPLWFQWARTVVFVLLFAEYMRLVMTTDVASYRTVVMIIWAILSVVSIVSLVQAIRQNPGSHDS